MSWMKNVKMTCHSVIAGIGMAYQKKVICLKGFWNEHILGLENEAC